MAEGMGMQIYIWLIVVAIASGLALAQPDRPPYPVNCTETFDHSYTLGELLDQFRDDDIRMNMSKASRAFWSHPDLTIEYLYNALNHEDWQVRQVMCDSIWKRAQQRKYDGSQRKYVVVSTNPDYPITEDLVRVTIEGLRHDTTPYDWARRRGLVIYNASSGISRLIPTAYDWAGLLEEAMESDDHQQRLLAAYILGRGGVAQSVERAAEILLPHLRDNTIWGDAKFSVYGLGGFGEELLPYLSESLPIADKQQRDLITLLIMDIKDPPTSEEGLRIRSRYNSITSTVYDPASQDPPGYMSWMNKLEN